MTRWHGYMVEEMEVVTKGLNFQLSNLLIVFRPLFSPLNWIRSSISEINLQKIEQK